jgi:hypothetical protein
MMVAALTDESSRSAKRKLILNTHVEAGFLIPLSYIRGVEREGLLCSHSTQNVSTLVKEGSPPAEGTEEIIGKE